MIKLTTAALLAASIGATAAPIPNADKLSMCAGFRDVATFALTSRLDGYSERKTMLAAGDLSAHPEVSQYILYKVISDAYKTTSTDPEQYGYDVMAECIKIAGFVR